MTLNIRFGYDIAIYCWQPTPIVTMMNLRDELLGDLLEPEVFKTDPMVTSSTYRDLFGNTCRRFVAPIGELSLSGTGVIVGDGEPDPYEPAAVQHPVEELPDECLLFLMGSRYCDTELLSQVAWDRFGPLAPGWGRVQAICDFAHDRIRFDYQNARSTRTAFEAYQERTGVCRDFAHLGVALCRAMNIPARYVNGYLGDFGGPPVVPMDYAAWIEVYLGGAWRTFDPRNNARRIGRIKIAHGRDAADVAMISSFGPHGLNRFNVICKAA